MMVYDENFKILVDLLLILFMVCISFSLILIHVATRKFRRSVIKKQHVDKEDETEFWSLGRVSCILSAIAAGSVAPSGFESGAIELTIKSMVIWILAFAAFGGGVSFFACWTLIISTRRTLKWRNKL